ncbi:expressed unknown protein [Seminavis robusta]|uniref:Transmembrane protein n=1 Tax=Seminavis robusta TaxID=568900 RepID=A0A9N8DUQ4_9STRA|nr:expressed unknown protein [Seminavis robusta]|eukprot:Sro290_g109300.1 n/a (83) ;mRNA; r:37624-37872
MTGNFFGETWDRIKSFTVPKPERNAQILCGICNCFFFGIGTIVAGIIENNLPDVAIGVLQLCVPFVGWVWSVIWGILMILDK